MTKKVIFTIWNRIYSGKIFDSSLPSRPVKQMGNQAYNSQKINTKLVSCYCVTNKKHLKWAILFRRIVY